jgi:hypothetical protein
MPAPPKWTPSRDIDFYSRINLEAAQLYYREMQVHKLDRIATSMDERYYESKNVVYRPFNVRAMCVINPKKTMLKKFGLDDYRDLLVAIPVAVLRKGTGEGGDYPESAGGFPLPLEGDLFVLEGEKYEVMDERREDYWWHTESNLTHTFVCNRLRDRSIDDEALVDENNPAGPVAVPKYSVADFPGEDDGD